MDTVDNNANDNGGLVHSADRPNIYGGDAIGRQSLLQERVEAQSPLLLSKKDQTRTNNHYKNNVLLAPASIFFLALCLWFSAIAGAFVAFQNVTEPMARIFILVGVGWSALLLAYVSKCQNREFSRDLGLSCFITILASTFFLATTSYNIPIDLFLLTGVAALITALLGNFLRERYFLTLSAMASLSWTALSLSQMQVSPLFWAFPALWILQMVASIELKAKLPLGLASLSGVIWVIAHLFILTNTAKISALMAICALFILSITYSRIGKYMQDTRVLSGLFQTNLGWIIAILSALLVQDYWLMKPYSPWADMNIAPVHTYPLMAQWGVFLVLCLLALGIFGALRLRLHAQSLSKTMLIMGFAILLPFSIAFHDYITSRALDFGLIATPALGILIGAAITCAALNMFINGYRQKKTGMLWLAIFTLGVETILVIETLYANPNNIWLFGFTISIIALSAGIYARKNDISTHKQVRHAS